MKKLSLFVSLLALSACGGGNGGNGDDGQTQIITPEQRAAAESNARITGMVSFLWAEDSDDSIARASTVTTLQNKKRYNLENVVFESADKQFQTNPNLDFTMKLKVDKNDEITHLISIDDGEEPETFKRDSEDRFNIDENHYAILNFEGVNFNKTRTNQYKMKYSDFGYVEMFEKDVSGKPKQQFIMPVVGGYAIKDVTAHINQNTLSQDLVFKGIAVGFVGEPCTEDEHAKLTLRDENAELRFIKLTGDEIMTANFDNWYSVTATKYQNGQARIVFDENAQNAIDNEFKFVVNGERKNAFATSIVENNTDTNKVSVGFHYYGDKNTPTEANGIVFYQHRQNPDGDPDDSASWLPVGIGFGGTVPTTQK